MVLKPQFWPWPRSRPRNHDLGFGLGLKHLASVWPRPSTLGLSIDLGLVLLASASTSASEVRPRVTSLAKYRRIRIRMNDPTAIHWVLAYLAFHRVTDCDVSFNGERQRQPDAGVAGRVSQRAPHFHAVALVRHAVLDGLVMVE